MHEKKLGIVIGVGNQKGGVGKTTNTVHLAAALGLKGYRSLVIDLDPSAGATRHLGVNGEILAGTLELLTTDETLEDIAVTEDMPEGVHLVPARLELSQLEKHLPKFVDRAAILDKPLEDARTKYDFIFLDTPPNPGAITTIAAYVAAEWFLLSVFPQHLSMESLAGAFNDIADVRAQRNENLEVLGVVFTCVDGRIKKQRQRLEDMVAKAVPGRKCENFTSQAKALSDSSSKGQTLFQVEGLRTHKVADQYRRLAIELEHRVLNRDAFIAGTLAPPRYDETEDKRPPKKSVHDVGRATEEAISEPTPVAVNE